MTQEDNQTNDEGVMAGPPGVRREVGVYLTLHNGVKCACSYREGSSTEEELVDIGVTVGAGQFGEGDMGIAHLVEGLLVLGSERYPQENGLHEYCRSVGGDFQITAEYEEILISLQVPFEEVRQALDRTADMLSSPLLPHHLFRRQIAKIQTQHEATCSDPTFQVWQLLRDLAEPGHDFHGFGTGCSDTLQTEECHNKTVQWVRSNLVGPKIAVGIVLPSKRLTKNEVEALMLETFSVLPKPSNAKLNTKPTTPPVLPVSGYIRARSTRPSSTPFLRLSFPVPVGSSEYESLPCKFVVHFLDSHHEGSLMSVLRATPGVTDATAYLEFQGRHWSLITISVTLSTPDVEPILLKVLQGLYIIRSQTNEQRVWEGLQALVSTHNALSEAVRCTGTQLASNLLVMKGADVLVGGKCFLNYRKDVIRQVLSSLEMANCVVVHCSPEFSVENLPLVSKWGFGVRHAIDAFTQQQLQRLADLTFPLDPGLQLPKTVRGSWLPVGTPGISPDIVLSDRTPYASRASPVIEVFTTQTDGTAESLVEIVMTYPVCSASPMHAAGLLIAVELLRWDLSPFAEEAAYHKLTFDVRILLGTHSKMMLTLHGCREVLPAFASDCVDAILKIFVKWCEGPIEDPEVYSECRDRAAAKVLENDANDNFLLAGATHRGKPLIQYLSQLQAFDLHHMLPSVLFCPAFTGMDIYGSFAGTKDLADLTALLVSFVTSLPTLVPVPSLALASAHLMYPCNTRATIVPHGARMTPPCFSNFLLPDLDLDLPPKGGDIRLESSEVTVQVCILQLPNTGDRYLMYLATVMSVMLESRLKKILKQHELPTETERCSVKAHDSCVSCVLRLRSDNADPFSMACVANAVLEGDVTEEEVGAAMRGSAVIEDPCITQDIAEEVWGVLPLHARRRGLRGLAALREEDTAQYRKTGNPKEVARLLGILLANVPSQGTGYTLTSITPSLAFTNPAKAWQETLLETTPFSNLAKYGLVTAMLPASTGNTPSTIASRGFDVVLQPAVFSAACVV
eukprot:TRINITY_DN1717_c3_g1_i1.p1 TRINITY_DN1717_c3_g1~~TRINITY_DN1717_c3_g1_i1.p1  ORF type:complete len:1039 (+),score=194.85 TRINITY_DN1717_c3_g1_i1:53-3118(+)